MRRGRTLDTGRAARAVLLAQAALLAACGGQAPSRTGDPALTVEVAVSPTPASTADTRVVVTLQDAGEPAAGWDVRVRGEGPDGAGVAATPLEDRGGGRYASGPITFPRPGEWTLVVEVSGRNGREAVFRRPTTVSAPGGR